MKLGIVTIRLSRAIAAALLAGLTGATAACGTGTKIGSDAGEKPSEPQPLTQPAQVTDSADVTGERTERANEVARTAYAAAQVAVVADPEDQLSAACGASLAKALGLPALASGDSLEQSAAELGVQTLVVVPQVNVDLTEGPEVWQPQSLAEIDDAFADVELRELPGEDPGVAQLMALGEGEVFACDWPEPIGGGSTEAGTAEGGRDGSAAVGQGAASSDKKFRGNGGEVPEQSAVALVGDEDVLAAGSLAAAGVPVVAAGAWPSGGGWLADAQGAELVVARAKAGEPVVMVGAAEDVSRAHWQVAVRAAGTELPGGGYEVFAGKRYVALYGTPVGPALGVLGEQDGPATIARAARQAEVYQGLSEDTIVPTLEMIATVASGGPGGDGNYSNEWPVETFAPLVEAAAEAGQYVVLDFQPGRSDFLSQVKLYEELLKHPHVGIALDPEWRLGPDELPLQRIGHVEIDEVNAVIHWLADFTRENGLPQKMVVLHQFQLQMLRDRDQLDTSRAEVALLIHADGQGSQGQKRATWEALRRDAPDGVRWGWKNFIDEDHPMLTEKQTFEIEPRPDFVSYQ